MCIRDRHYSVPDRLVGREVPIKMYSERIVVLDGRDKVATHVRSRRLGDWCIDLMHYLGCLLYTSTTCFSGYSLILSEKSDYIRNFCVKSDDYNSLFISIWNNAHNFDVQ